MFFLGDVMYALGMNTTKKVCVGLGQTDEEGKKFAKFDDIVELGEFLAFLISLAQTDTHLLCGVHAKGIHDISEEEHVKLAFAIPIVDVTDFLNSVSVNHFEIGRFFASLDLGELKVG